MKPVIRRVNDDGILGQTLFLQSFHETPDGPVDSTDHAKISPHVDLVLVVGIPSPEESFPIDGVFQKKRLIGKDFRVIQTRGNHNLFLVHSVDCEGPGKMTDSGPSVAVLGVTCVEPHVYGKGLILGLVLQKFDSAVDDQFGLVAQTAVFLPSGHSNETG